MTTGQEKDVRLDEFWGAMKTRLQTARMTDVLYGANRVFRVTDSYPLGLTADTPQGRLILRPVVNLWGTAQYVPGETWKEGFLVVAEFGAYRAANYEVTFDLEAAQEEAFALLEYWAPTGFTRCRVVNPVYRRNYPQGAPVWDEGRGVWLTSSTYGVEVAPA